jgi:hypothetical protein
MAISNDWTNKSLKIQQEKEKAEAFQAGMQNALMMVSSVRQPNPEDPAYRDKQLKRRYDEINNPKRPTEGQLLGGKKPTYTEKEWLKRTGAQLPNLIRTIKPKPQDVLKILQYLPALTGGGLGQMASSRSLREHLKPGTKGLRDYDKSGGGRGIPEDEWLKLIRSAPKV